MFTRSKSAQIPDFIPEDQEHLYPQSGKQTADFVPDPVALEQPDNRCLEASGSESQEPITAKDD
jgi:hypothetical protein